MFILLLLLLHMAEVMSYNIILLPVNMMSRYSSFGPLAEALLKRGHNVTMVIGAKMAVPDEMASTDLDLAFYDMLGTPLSESQDLGKIVYQCGTGTGNDEMMRSVLSGMEEELEQIFLDETLMHKLSKTRYHLAVTDTPNILRVLPYRLGIPYVTMGTECPWWEMSLPYLPSHVPHVSTSYGEVMTWKERVRNLMTYLMMSPLYQEDGSRKCAMYAGNRRAASYSEINANISFCLRLREMVTDTFRGFPPNVINVGRMLTRRARPLPERLGTFVSGAEDGFILVSFGSWFNQWPTRLIHNLLEAFARAHNIRVIWKFTIPSAWTFRLPDNVRTFDWLPQNDLLGHPKCKLFISHLGIHGLTEAVYHGVPLLGFPMGLDQHANAAIVRQYGYGLTLDIHRFTDLQLYKTIKNILAGDYAEKTKKAAAILKSFPSGSDSAVFWIEHVIRHGDGHLRSRADVRWWEYLMLDIIGFITLVVITGITVIYVIAERCYYLCTGSKIKRD